VRPASHPSSALDATIRDVKARTDLVALVARHVALTPAGGVHRGRSLKNPDRTPSLIVWPETRTWRDFSGGGADGGDCIDFVRYATGASFLEALHSLAADAGVRWPDHAGPGQGVGDTEARRRLEELLGEAAAFYHRALRPGLREREFKERYGFRDETIDELRLGFGAPGLYEHLTGAFGATRDEALSTGLFVLVHGEARDFFANRLVFPYWRGGRIVYFIGRRSHLSGDEPWDAAKYRKLPGRCDTRPYVSPLVGNDAFFGEDDAQRSGTLVICEGIADAISAREAGFACISPVTTRFRTQDHEKLVRLTARADRVVIANDNEENRSGERGALETARVLHAAGRDVRIAVLPRAAGVEKVDVNDIVRTQGHAAFQRVVADALPLPAYLVASLDAGLRGAALAKALQPAFACAQGLPPLEQGDALRQMEERFALGKREVRRAFDHFVRAHREAGAGSRAADSGLPRVVVNGRQQRELIEEAAAIVVAANERRLAQTSTPEPEAHAGDIDVVPKLFVRSGIVVGLRSEADGPRVVDVNETEMLGVLLRCADWISVHSGDDGPSYSAATPPIAVPRDLLAFPPRGLRPLDAVVQTPVFGRDGALLDGAGYHASDRLWHLWHEVAPSRGALGGLAVPRSPSRVDIVRARCLLEDELLADFPFVDESDRAHALAALLLPFARRLVGGCTPLHLIEAPTAGSGKGMLGNIVSIVATGGVCEARTMPMTEDETRKMITAELASARPIVLLDNLSEKRVLDSPSLASLLTTPVWRDRILGESRSISLRNDALWLGTANNPRISFELARRMVRIRIDPKQDMPWRRSGFRHDPLFAWVHAERPSILQSLLVLIQAWVAAGRPRGRERLGSFESWAAVMGGILEVAGVRGFLCSLDEFYQAADEQGEVWRGFARLWWERFQGREVRVAELQTLCGEGELGEALLGDGSPRAQATRLGRALQSARDRVFGGLRVRQLRDSAHKGRTYALELAAAPPDGVRGDSRDEIDPFSRLESLPAAGDVEVSGDIEGTSKEGGPPSESVAIPVTS